MSSGQGTLSGHHQLVSLMQVMFVPQKAIAAPGGTLLEQLTYPAVLPADPASLDKQNLANLLDQVGLTELLQRVQGDWLLNHNWQGTVPALSLLCNAQAMYMTA